ncbi:hypothetical protein [Novacetimonas pomaceti]|uniref:hypothetical protein n=1 Tax=Novacetimonas pomaceti TaxID=2021998 RepID=UPI0010576601|nr:hypothetical protein [Novacetimonas pomaceti]
MLRPAVGRWRDLPDGRVGRAMDFVARGRYGAGCVGQRSVLEPRQQWLGRSCSGACGVFV